MVKTWRSFAAAAIVSLSLAAGAAHAQTCNPGVFEPYNASPAQFDKLIGALLPSGGTVELDGLNTHLEALGTGATFADNQALYATLLSHARSLVATINTPNPVGGRVLIALPDGTTVIDTSKSDDPGCDTTVAACSGWNGFPVPPPAGCACSGQKNSWGHYLKKSVNENHQSRIAIHDAQEWPCGYGMETKFSSSTNLKEHYLAIRLAAPAFGGHLNNTGTVRASLRE